MCHLTKLANVSTLSLIKIVIETVLVLCNFVLDVCLIKSCIVLIQTFISVITCIRFTGKCTQKDQVD